MNRNSGVRAFERPRRVREPLADELLSPKLDEAFRLEDPRLEEASGGGGELESDSAVKWARSNKRDGVYNVRPEIVQSVCRLIHQVSIRRKCDQEIQVKLTYARSQPILPYFHLPRHFRPLQKHQQPRLSHPNQQPISLFDPNQFRETVSL